MVGGWKLRPEFPMDFHHGTTEPGYNVYLSIGFDGSGRSQVSRNKTGRGGKTRDRMGAETEGYNSESIKKSILLLTKRDF